MIDYVAFPHRRVDAQGNPVNDRLNHVAMISGAVVVYPPNSTGSVIRQCYPFDAYTPLTALLANAHTVVESFFGTGGVSVNGGRAIDTSLRTRYVQTGGRLAIVFSRNVGLETRLPVPQGGAGPNTNDDQADITLQNVIDRFPGIQFLTPSEREAAVAAVIASGPTNAVLGPPLAVTIQYRVRYTTAIAGSTYF